MGGRKGRSIVGRKNVGRKNVDRIAGKSPRGAVRAIAVLFALLLTAGALGCGSAGSGEAKLSASTTNFTEGDDLKEDTQRADYSKVTVTNEFRQSYADFSLTLLRGSRKEENQAAEETDNMMVSPLSAMLALEMTRSGAREETEAEMAKTLYGELSVQEGREQLLSYMQSLPSEEKARFHLANSIWFRTEGTDFVPNEEFLNACAADYEAELYGAPFDKSTLKDINRWVEAETDGMIKDILNEIPEDAILYLINAMAFDAEWRQTYETYQIRQAEFFPAEEQTRTVDMMYSDEGTYLSDGAATGFLKPYRKGYAFAALLPAEGTSVDEYLAKLTGEDFVKLMETAEETPVNAGLPKFSARMKLSLNQVLKEMGMPLAFDEIQADFSGMGESSGNIYISRVLQDTFIEVDALGTRAGAATVVEATKEEAAAEPVEPKNVILDRPFVYAIVDAELGLPIFLGIVDLPGV